MGKWQKGSLLAAAAAVSLVGVSTAQVSGGDLARSAAGQLTGDLRPDAVVLAGDKPILLYGVGIYRAQLDLSDTAIGAVTDVVVVKGSGGLDTVIASHAAAGAGGDGLSTLSIDVDNSTFTWTQISGTAAWVNARRLRVADLDGQGGDDDLMGVSSSGTQVLRMQDPLAASPYQPGAITPNINSDIVAFVPVNWGDYPTGETGWGAGADELALISGGGATYVFDQTSVERKSVPIGAPGDHLVALGRAGDYDLLAGVVLGSNTAYYAVSMDDAVGLRPAVFLGWLPGVSGVHGALWDDDGLEDLLFAHDFARNLAVLYQQPTNSTSVPPFVWGQNSSEVHDYDTGEQYVDETNTGWPIFHDFDVDGDLDLLFPYESDGTVRGVRNPAVDYNDYGPEVTDWNDDYDVNLLSLTIDPVPTNFDTDMGFTPNRIEYTVWERPNPGDPTEQDPELTGLAVLPLSGGTLDLDVDVSGNEVISVELRYVEVDASDDLLSAGPSSLYLGTQSTGAQTYVNDNYGDVLDTEAIAPATGATNNPAPPNSRISTTLSRSHSVPNFGANQLPPPSV